MNALNILCTITTKSHLSQTEAMGKSAVCYSKDVVFHVLVTDLQKEKLPANTSNKYYYAIGDVQSAYKGKEIIKKYASSPDKLRWSLKPVFLHYLITQKNAKRLLYADNDIFFFNDFTFLFEALNNNNVLLCPHWRCSHPSKSKDWFLINFTDGFYNAGFLGVNSNGTAMLEWWADACLFKCAKVMRKGLFDDQKYLDFVPLLFENTNIIKHRGCNVAYWNQIENKRTLVNNEVMINDIWPVVFIHFTQNLIKSIRKGKDPFLEPFLEKYAKALSK